MADSKVVKPKRKKNYLNNASMMIQIHASREQKEMTAEFTKMMIMLTDRYGSQAKFANYTYNDDMRAYALYMICRTWDRFNPERSANPFAFFTQCIKHSFYQYLNKEKKQRNVRDLLLINSGLNPSNTYITDYEQTQIQARNEPSVPVEENVEGK